MTFLSFLLPGIYGVCSRVFVPGMSVRLFWYLCRCGDCDTCTVVCVCVLRE